jgi:hypothetical protein
LCVFKDHSSGLLWLLSLTDGFGLKATVLMVSLSFSPSELEVSELPSKTSSVKVSIELVVEFSDVEIGGGDFSRMLDCFSTCCRKMTPLSLLVLLDTPTELLGGII